MPERLERQLGPEAKQALALARRLAEKAPVVKRVKSLPVGARAMLNRPRIPDRPYEIQVHRGEERFLDHLVTHEVGHLVRLHQVPEEDRLFPVASAATRRVAIHQLAPDIGALMNRGLPEKAVPELFESWYRNIVTQLVSFPADLRIEQWIFDRFPGLHRVQERSLLKEVGRAIPLFLPEVEALTPRILYRATMAMNAAQAAHVGELYGLLPHVQRPFEASGFVLIGKQLMRSVFERADEGHRSDIAATKEWSRALALAGWLEWRLPTPECLGIEIRTP